MSDRTPHLTNDASKRVNWQIIDDVFGALTATQRKREAPVAFEPLTDQQREAARRAFDVVKEEFAKAIDWIRTTMRIVIVGVALAIGIAVSGGALLQVTPWASLISIASIGTLFALIPKAFGLARDQVLLELAPARYALDWNFARQNKICKSC
jgi:hypothetical protein